MRRVHSRDIGSRTLPSRTYRKDSVDRTALGRRSVGNEQVAPGSLDQGKYAPRSTAERHVEPAMIPRDRKVIDFGDSTVLTGYSKAHYPNVSGYLYLVQGALSVIGTTNTVAEIIQNGVAIGTLTIPANESTGFSRSAELVPWNAYDSWQMRVTSAGAGALGLSFFGSFGS